MIKIKIGKKTHQIPTKFRQCRAVYQYVKDVDLQNPLSLVGAIMDNGAKIVIAALEASGVEDLPTEDQVMEAFDNDEGLAGEIVMAFIDKTSKQLSRERADEIQEAVEGN